MDQERANTITHAIGVAASLLGGAALVVLAALRGTAWDIVGVSIFAGALIILYSASTAYHAARHPAVRVRLKVLDHSAIYVLIAGSYTPFMIGRLRGGWGWSLFGVIWGLALAGVVFKVFVMGRRASAAASGAGSPAAVTPGSRRPDRLRLVSTGITWPWAGSPSLPRVPCSAGSRPSPSSGCWPAALPTPPVHPSITRHGSATPTPLAPVRAGRQCVPRPGHCQHHSERFHQQEIRR